MEIKRQLLFPFKNGISYGGKWNMEFRIVTKAKWKPENPKSIKLGKAGKESKQNSGERVENVQY
jgi:hypothetical protein